MTASIVTRCEVYMSVEEQEMLGKVARWIEAMDEEEWDDLPKGIQEMLLAISDNINDLLSLIPEEH